MDTEATFKYSETGTEIISGQEEISAFLNETGVPENAKKLR